MGASMRITVNTAGTNTKNMSEETGQNQLVSYYHQYVGDPDRTIDIYAGFGLFFLGLGLGLAGVLIFLYSATLSEAVYSLREIAIVTGAIGTPALLVGIVVLLPVDKRMLAIAGIGSGICGIGIIRFVDAYPYNFNVAGPDATAEVVGIYSVGLVLVIAATAAALIAHHVEQAAERTPTTGTEQTNPSTDGNESVTDADVQADIKRELDQAELSLGGVEKRETRRLNLDTTELDDMNRDSLPDPNTKTRTSDNRVDDAVSQLDGLQGKEKKTKSGESTDDQVAALSELKEQQADSKSDTTLSERFKNLFSSK